MSKDKIKIHIRNNHWKKGSLPCDLEGEKNSSVPKDLFENMLNTVSYTHLTLPTILLV